jgi:hypothetical protein
MDKDEIIEMARQAGFITDGHWAYEFTTFAKLVAAKHDPKIAIADAYRAGVDSGIAAERAACDAIRKALAEQHLQDLHDENVRLGLYEQGEPAAWMDIDEKGAASGLRYWSEPDNRHEVALYSAPPQRKPLTDEQIEQMWGRTGDYDSFARAIEAAHGIKE